MIEKTKEKPASPPTAKSEEKPKKKPYKPSILSRYGDLRVGTKAGTHHAMHRDSGHKHKTA